MQPTKDAGFVRAMMAACRCSGKCTADTPSGTLLSRALGLSTRLTAGRHDERYGEAWSVVSTNRTACGCSPASDEHIDSPHAASMHG